MFLFWLSALDRWSWNYQCGVIGAAKSGEGADSSLACILSDTAEEIDISKSLLTYPTGSFCFVPDELLENGSLRGGLTAFKGTELSFVGISEPFTVADGDETPHA